MEPPPFVLIQPDSAAEPVYFVELLFQALLLFGRRCRLRVLLGFRGFRRALTLKEQLGEERKRDACEESGEQTDAGHRIGKRGGGTRSPS